VPFGNSSGFEEDMIPECVNRPGKREGCCARPALVALLFWSPACNGLGNGPLFFGHLELYWLAGAGWGQSGYVGGGALGLWHGPERVLSRCSRPFDGSRAIRSC
jgi:hypothetical protein